MKVAVVQIWAFGTALDLYKADNGSYPLTKDGLQALVVKPGATLTNWHEYIDRVPPDSWGRGYIYECPGRHNTNSYDLISAGPDGRVGTADDLTNWK